MGADETLLSRIEDKIRTMGEQLIRVRSENAVLLEERSALKNKIADLEESMKSAERPVRQSSDQIDRIKKELDGYITEVEECLNLVNKMSQ